MSQKRIFTIGFDLPGSEFEYVEFESSQTLLDADIILFKPTFGSCDFEYEHYNGRPVLSRNSSFKVREHFDHWSSEIVAAVKAGKLVIVFLAPPVEYCRYTGQQQHSGTGRSRVTTNIVEEISSYGAVPNISSVKAKAGSEISPTRQVAYFAPYWSEFGELSPYEVEIVGTFTQTLLRSRAGDRIVGAAVRDGSGALIFVPPIKYDRKAFIRKGKKSEDENKEYWTPGAFEFGKRLVAALVGMSNALAQARDSTPPPTWSLDQEYRLAREREFEAKIAATSATIAQKKVELAALQKDLRDAGRLRHLLFEQGILLEEAILDAMRLLGFTAEPFANRESEFDGIFVSVEGRCIGEAEGKDNKAIDITKFSQLERNIAEDFARDEVTEHAKGLLFGNAQRLNPIRERGEFFTAKCASAAARTAVALIRTPDLFDPARYLAENPDDSDYAALCRQAIFAARGAVVSFPSVPQPLQSEQKAICESMGSEASGPNASAA